MRPRRPLRAPSFIVPASGPTVSSSAASARRTPRGCGVREGASHHRRSCTPTPSSVKESNHRGRPSRPWPPRTHPRPLFVIAPATGDVERRTSGRVPARRKRARRCQRAGSCWASDQRAYPQGAGPCATLDRFGGFASGLSKVRVQVHEARSHPAVARVELVGVLGASIVAATSAIRPATIRTSATALECSRRRAPDG